MSQSFDAKPEAAALVGAWRLTSIQTAFEDGSVSQPYGLRAQGRIIYCEDGFMAAHLWDPDRHVEGAVAGCDPAYFSYCGTWRLDGERVHHAVLAATAPGWAGTERARTIRWDGDVLELFAAVVSDGVAGEAVIRWSCDG